jgi:WD40 repeat protein
VPLLAAASPAPADASTHLAIDSSGRFLALGHHRKLRVWDCVESRLILDLAEPRIGSVSKAFSGIQGLAFAPDGRSLAVVDDSASVVVDVTSWLPAAWCAWEGEVSRVSFSPDGRRLVIQGQRLQIFDPSTGFLVAEVPDASAGGLVMEGHRLLVAGTVIQVVDLESGRELGRIKAATTAASATLALRLAADGVLSIYRNETLERWSLPELERGFREGKGTLDLTESADSSALLDMRMIPISPASLFPWYTITERLLSPDGAWLVDRWHPYLQILSAATLKPAGHIRLPEYHGGIRIGFTKDSQLFVLGPDGISLWNLTAPKVETVSGSK